MKNILKNKIIITTLIIVILVGSGLFYRAYEYRYVAATDSSVVIYVDHRASIESITDSLGSALINPKKFKKFAKNNKLDQNFSTGKYSFPASASYASIIRHINLGMQTPVRVTFNNIRTFDKLASAASKNLELDSLSLLDHLTQESTAQSYGFAPETFLSMFIPNTYELYWNTTTQKFTDRMAKEYETFWNPSRQAKADSLGMTREQVITLASIVYEETKMSNEMPTVSGVYINRLNRNIPLQADPTVKFAVGDFTIRRVLNKHLEVDSPYNTYKYAGLPPGPICMPSIKAIDSVLDYERHNYIYFCAKDDMSGYHAFARTLSEHNANARRYYAALNRLKIFK